MVPPGVFDAYGWCASDVLEWRRPDGGDKLQETRAPLDGANPARMVFVLRAPCTFLPMELACLHAFRLGLTDEMALAPYGIDDATDGLFEHRLRPTDAMWLAADNLNALVWGLHDWAHFHNHGPFEQRAWTELQCDGTALAWLRRNRDAVGLDEAELAHVEGELVRLSRGRFEAEALDPAPVAPTLAALGRA